MVNAFTGAAGEGKDQTRRRRPGPFPDIAKRYSEAGIAWCAVGDQNYGEGSSREHAAMEPRFRGGRRDLRPLASPASTRRTSRSRASCPLTFADPATYDQIGEDDRISVLGLAQLAPDEPVHCQIHKPDGTVVDFQGTQTFSPEQIEWFRAGSALNIIRARMGG